MGKDHMIIRISAGEILDRADWDKFCALKGINEWALNEGRMDSEDMFDLTLDEARQIGLNLGTLIQSD